MPSPRFAWHPLTPDRWADFESLVGPRGACGGCWCTVWCAVAPRADYPALARSRVLQPVDDTPVWSVSCLFVHKDHRKKGLSVRMLRAAVEHVKKQGGTVVEGYPIEPKTDEVTPVFAWTGLASAFRAAGFTEVARRSDTRPIMRCVIRRKASGVA